MKSGTFFGGVHPYDGKELTKDKPIAEFIPSGEMVFPLQQHIGAQAKPVVSKGDYVMVGQKIAEADGFVSAHVYSSCSGVVKNIEPRLTVSGDKVMAIVVDNDRKFTSVEYKEEDTDNLSPSEIIERIKEAGVVGMGGAGFPTHVKLSPKNPDGIDYVIVNGAECEPYLTSDYRRMLDYPEKIVNGLDFVLRLFPSARGIIAVEDNKSDAAVLLEKICLNKKNIKVSLLKTKYPQGSERQLIYACTGRKLNSSMLPTDKGCIVQNIDTVSAIYDAVKLKHPLMHRIVTVTGDCIKTPSNYRVPIGTSYKELVEKCGGFIKTPVQLISGGPMMGLSMFDLDVPVIKTSSALLCMSENDVRTHKATACINCGKCADICPERLMPMMLIKASDTGNKENFEKLYGMECIECGACSYICPAKRPLTHSFRTMRRRILADRKEKK